MRQIPTRAWAALPACAAMLVVGYWLGSAHAPDPAMAQNAPLVGIPYVVGVSIPENGGALVKGKDGLGYVVDRNGRVIPARGNGRSLELP